MRHPLRLLLAAVLVTALAVVTLVVLGTSADDPTRAGPEPFRTTPLEGFDTATLTVPRGPFCADVDPRQVAAALGSEPVDAQGYDNGDEVSLADGLTDVAHEFGCVWTAEDGSEARAWVFAPPVDQRRARRLVRQSSRSEGCEASPSPAYGTPSVGLNCRDATGARASYRGLFGDAWLTCELTSLDPAVDPAEMAEMVERTGAWCVGVARAAAGQASSAASSTASG